MNITEAITNALEYENRVRDVYKDNADKLKSDTAKKIFAVLAKEEQDHVDYLKAKLAEEQSGKAIAGDIETVVPDLATVKKNIKELTRIPSEKYLDDEIKIFQQALKLEVETSRFYKDLVGKLSSENQTFFDKFIEIEEGHEMIVQAEIDNAKKLGFWFDFMEFDLEAG